MENSIETLRTCCFTGNRPQKLPWGFEKENPEKTEYQKKLFYIVRKAAERGFIRFVCGMAMGADTMFAQSVLALKKEFPKVQLEAAVPCRGQENSWQEADRALYRSLLLKCDTVTYVSENYSPGCMQKRNRYMADKSSLLIALSFGDKGGTENTIKYAARRGLEIIRL